MEHSFEISTEDGSLDKSIIIDSACHLNVTQYDRTNISSAHIHMRHKHIHKIHKKPKHIIKKENVFANQDFFNPSIANNSEFSTEQTQSKKIRKYDNYPMFDLTRTLYTAFPSLSLLKLICLVATIVRVYLIFYFFSVLGVTTGYRLFRWYFLIPGAFAIFGSRLLYLIMVMKVGLTSPQNYIQRILKNTWNKQNIRINQIFQYLTFTKLAKCFIKGIIPVQVCFIYLKRHKGRRSLIYCMINFIYISIESVFVFPFVVVYNIYVLVERIQGTESFWKYTWITCIMTMVWIIVFSTLCGYLVVKGYKLKKQIV